MRRILFANIGWMTHYCGLNPSDTITGGGSYKDDDKHETYNFQNLDGWCYGFVQPVRWGSICLENIDPDISHDSESIDDVLVIWTARRPDSGGTYIVGWYKQAVVYRKWKNSGRKERSNYPYNIKARYEDCTLLQKRDRTYLVPRARKGENEGFMGQSNVWYANKEISKVKIFRMDVIAYVDNYNPDMKTYRKRIKVNVEARKQVETAAIKFVTEAYENSGYKVKTVEKENLGWDLEATNGNVNLRIEVKGLAGEEISVHLTQNEYAKMKNINNSDYRLCVVTEAVKSPQLSTFTYEDGKWICEEDDTIVLSFDEQIAAIAFV